MAVDFKKYLVIAISSRALFDLELENKIFEQKGLEKYTEYQLEHQSNVPKPGTGFQLVKNILKINKVLENVRKAEVIILSRNNAETSLRITKSIEHYKLDITRSAWTGGEPISKYLKPFEVDLFLSANSEDVQDAINAGFAAGKIYEYKKVENDNSEERDIIKIAFDCDAVIFSEEAEKIYREQGLDAFLEHEKKNAKRPLPEGPFAKLLKTLSYIQKAFRPSKSPIRTALVTSRNSPAHERVIRTLSTWKVRIDEVFFLGGMEKHKLLKAFSPDIYFDDQDVYCIKSAKFVPTARVPKKKKK